MHQGTIFFGATPGLVLARLMTANKTRVAVVDDDESFSRALGRMLRASGFDIEVYHTAEAFISNVANARLDCAVLDIHLGGMSGPELRRRMLALSWATPVIFVTAHDEPEVRREAEAVGCSAYLRKPCSRRLLVDAILKAVATNTPSR